MALDICVYHTEGCANTLPAIQRIRDIARDAGIEIELRQVQVADDAQAEEFRFLGSPTVQVNGLDIDPTVRTSTTFGLA
jgi:hypothetical protein